MENALKQKMVCHTESHDSIALEDDSLAGLEGGNLASGILGQQFWGDLSRSDLNVDASIFGGDEHLRELRVLVSVDLEHHREIRKAMHG